MNKALDYVWDTISFPKSASLGKRVPKKQFLESDRLVAGDKKLLSENVKNVYWEQTLKPSTCPVMPFKDNKREYLEVEILQIELAFAKSHYRIAEIIHRAIPYPLMLGFYVEEDKFSLSIAPKRFSQAEHRALVAERFFTTGWMNCNRLNKLESDFIQSLAWSSIPLQNYGTLYNAWVERFTGYECSVLSGTFAIGESGDRLEWLTQYREIETKILELRLQLKKSVFNQQVELNIKIKKFEQELRQIAAKL